MIVINFICGVIYFWKIIASFQQAASDWEAIRAISNPATWSSCCITSWSKSIMKTKRWHSWATEVYSSHLLQLILIEYYIYGWALCHIETQISWKFGSKLQYKRIMHFWLLSVRWGAQQVCLFFLRELNVKLKEQCSESQIFKILVISTCLLINEMNYNCVALAV